MQACLYAQLVHLACFVQLLVIYTHHDQRGVCDLHANSMCLQPQSEVTEWGHNMAEEWRVELRQGVGVRGAQV